MHPAPEETLRLLRSTRTWSTHAVLTLDALDAQIAALEAELGLRASVEEGPGVDTRRFVAGGIPNQGWPGNR